MRNIIPFIPRSYLTADIFNDMDQFFNDVKWTHPSYETQRAPACEVSEDENKFLMSLDIPGMKKEDIKIEMVNNTLTISGERKRETPADETRKTQSFERSYGFFKRSFTLPTSIDVNQIQARYEDGVLELLLPKSPVAKPRQIEILSGKQ